MKVQYIALLFKLVAVHVRAENQLTGERRTGWEGNPSLSEERAKAHQFLVRGLAASLGLSKSEVAKPTDPRARRVAELALEDIQGHRGIDDLAMEADASARTISRIFASETDLTFKRWRQRARILAALEILSGEQIQIAVKRSPRKSTATILVML